LNFGAKQISRPASPAEENQEKSGVNDKMATRQSFTLASKDDPDFLNPLHCFVRKNVELFIANERDVAAPAPGRKNRVVLGQVGIRCIHCVNFSGKKRVKRAVCYPPSVEGIYHSVSNMKFDHFAVCPCLPPAVQEEFTSLKHSFSRRGPTAIHQMPFSGLVRAEPSVTTLSNSTAKYYHRSALAKGLVDTESGIRFSNHEADNKRHGTSEEPKTVEISDEAKEYRKDVASSHSPRGYSEEYLGLSALAIAAFRAG